MEALVAIDIAADELLAMGQASDTEARKELARAAMDQLVGTDDAPGAFALLEKTRQSTAPDHPVQAYLMQSYLVAYRNYRVAHQELSGTVLPENEHRAAAIAVLAELRSFAGQGATDREKERVDEMVQSWLATLNIAKPELDAVP
jgi:hypothetical protein